MEKTMSAEDIERISILLPQYYTQLYKHHEAKHDEYVLFIKMGLDRLITNNPITLEMLSKYDNATLETMKKLLASAIKNKESK